MSFQHPPVYAEGNCDKCDAIVTFMRHWLPHNMSVTIRDIVRECRLSSTSIVKYHVIHNLLPHSIVSEVAGTNRSLWLCELPRYDELEKQLDVMTKRVAELEHLLMNTPSALATYFDKREQYANAQGDLA